jgi:hypothetical protein
MNSSGKDKYKVLLVGDSHARNCASLLQDDLGTDFTVTSFVQSSANMKQIINTTEDLLTSQSDDLVVIWGGAIDIRKNNMRETVKLVSKFVETNRHQNVILINSPHRYDLSRESCINTEVAKFNKQIKKIMEHQPQVEILELALDRHHFTTHGLHLNSKGKSVVTQNLAMAVKQCVIPIPWKDHPPNNINTTMELQDTSILPPIYLKWIEESSVCDAPNSDFQSSSIATPTVKEDHCHQSTLDSESLDATSTDSKLKNLLNDCPQSSSTRTSTRMPGHCIQATSDSASSEVNPTDSKLEVILNSTGKDIVVNKSKTNDKVSDQSRLLTRNSNRLKKQPASKTDDFFYGCNITFLF